MAHAVFPRIGFPVFSGGAFLRFLCFPSRQTTSFLLGSQLFRGGTSVACLSFEVVAWWVKPRVVKCSACQNQLSASKGQKLSRPISPGRALQMPGMTNSDPCPLVMAANTRSRFRAKTLRSGELSRGCKMRKIGSYVSNGWAFLLVVTQKPTQIVP